MHFKYTQVIAGQSIWKAPLPLGTAEQTDDVMAWEAVSLLSINDGLRLFNFWWNITAPAVLYTRVGVKL